MAARVRVLLAGVLALALSGCAGTSEAEDRAVPTPRPSTAPDQGGSAAAELGGVPVWFVGATPAGDRLFRETRALADAAPLDRAGAAVTELLEGRPAHPGRRTDWPAGVALRSPVTHAGGVLTVDLAVAGPLPGPAGLALQQLVWTVQGAAGSADPVRVLVGGMPVRTLLGAPVAGPLEPDDPYAVRSLVQLDEPSDGAVLDSPVRVTGEAAVFEATVLWEIRDPTGLVVRAGFATTAEGQRFAPFRFEIPLGPGDYELVISEDDPSGGEGRPPMTDTARITVR